MCGYGGCKLTCENCKPKLVKCPNCGKKSQLILDKCIFCKTHIPEEIKEAARREWQAARDKSLKE